MSAESHLAPESLRASISNADRLGRALVTLIDGRVAIILPVLSEDDQVRAVADVAKALDWVK